MDVTLTHHLVCFSVMKNEYDTTVHCQPVHVFILCMCRTQEHAMLFFYVNKSVLYYVLFLITLLQCCLPDAGR